MMGIGWPVRAGVFERAGVFDRTLVTFRVCLPNEADTPELLFHVSIEPKLQTCKVRAEQQRSKRSTVGITAWHCTHVCN